VTQLSRTPNIGALAHPDKRHASPRSTPREMAGKLAATLLAVVLMSANFAFAVATFGASPAAADTAPVDPSLETVSAAALPTVQINGVVWDQVIVGNRVYATGQFTSARPAGAAAGTNETPRSNILAYDLTTGNLVTSWAPSLNAQGMEIKTSADGSTIYVGGDFDHVSGVTRSRIAAIDAQTGALRSWNPGANSRVDAIAVNGNTVYFGGAFTSVGNSTSGGAVPRTRLAAANASTGAILPWAPAADMIVNTMVFHPGTGHVIVGGTFDTLNGTQQFGMGSLDGVTGAVQPWPVNTIIMNHGGKAAINSLTTDGTKVYGVGWAFVSGGGTGNFEGAFSADAVTGALDWVEGGRGDNYDIAVTGNVLYTVGHPHDWGMVDWNPQTNPVTAQRAMAIDKRRSPTLTNAIGTPSTWQAFPGRPAAQPLHWLPTLTAGTYTGMFQGAWSVDTNGTYAVLGGEFPRVNAINQQGLVRFAKRTTSPLVDAIQGYPGLTPVVTALAPGTVRLGWTAAWDRDNSRLTVEVLRGSTTATSTVLKSFQTDGTTWWNQPPLGFLDTTAPPGSTQTYRIRVTDPFGNGFSGPPTTVTIPGGAPTPSPYAASVLADSPSWQWRLDEASGTKAYDRAGSNDLTLNSANTRNIAGALLNEPDSATNFPGTTSTTTVQGVSPFWGSAPQAFSLEAWVRTSTSSGGKIIGFGQSNTGRSAANGNDRNLYMNNSGQIYFGVRPDMGTRTTINSPATYRDNQWHHVVATLGSDGMKLYVDAKLVASRTTPTKGQVYRGYWRVGGDQLSSWPSVPAREAITANLDEIAVYPYALSASRIGVHYAASGRGTIPNSPPTAAFTFSTQLLTASFNASGSSDSDGSITAYNWNFGDGTTGTGVTPQHTYANAGSYTVALTVTDNRGDVGTATHTVTVSASTPPPPTEFASDTFERTVSSGFGSADVGGAWTLSGVASSFSVGGGTGRIGGAVGASASAFLTGVRQRDMDITCDIGLDTPASGGGAYLSLIGRRVSSGNDYRLKVRYQAGGSVAVFLSRTVGGAETTIASATVPGLTVNPGDRLRTRFQVSGTTTATLRAKVWRVGATEPAAWLLETADATPAALQTAGDVGVSFYVSGSWTGPLPAITLDNLDVGPLAS
jgi:PKD repeat protein